MKWLVEWVGHLRVQGCEPVCIQVRDDCAAGCAFAVLTDGWQVVMSPLDWLPIELELVELASFYDSRPALVTGLAPAFSVLGIPVVFRPE